MITSDKKKAALLGLLVVMAVLSWYFVMRPGMTTATAGAATKPAGATKPIKLGPATIDLALLKEQSTNDVGQKNIFTFRQKPVPKPTASVVPAQTIIPVGPLSLSRLLRRNRRHHRPSSRLSMRAYL